MHSPIIRLPDRPTITSSLQPHMGERIVRGIPVLALHCIIIIGCMAGEGKGGREANR